ncbi:collagenase [Yinghuangia seranimata]|uniref:collagenase n=1 Tax=Yinghuangia seranimata TaxID=408067 RepID=UPI00248C7ABD|nr:collagenase [Yinghuangia seranimata]MDI2127278.1 collagenase [Yinghuangia seranimata]MDI2132223.1 collagenase [Yinghuangia seranimata]
MGIRVRRRPLIATSASLAALALAVLPATGASAAGLAPAPAPHSTTSAAPAGGTTATPQGGTADDVDHLGKGTAGSAADSRPGSITVAGKDVPATGKAPNGPAAAPAPAVSRFAAPAAVPGCTLAEFSQLSPKQLADFLVRPDVKASTCLKPFLWTYSPELARVLTPGHLKAVLDRIVQLAPSYDGTDNQNLYELWYFTHAALYIDWNANDVNLRVPAVLDPLSAAIDAYRANPKAFGATTNSAATMLEVVISAGTDTVRPRQLGLFAGVFNAMNGSTTAWQDPAWQNVTLQSQVQVYNGMVYEADAYRAAVAADPAYRAALKAFVGYTHLNANAGGLLRNGIFEYGRIGLVPAVRAEVTAGLADLLTVTENAYGKYGVVWSETAHWLEYYGLCKQYDVCKADLEAKLFPHTYSYDNGDFEVHTGLDAATVEQLYYASKQVKTQFLRIVGSDQPVAGDVNHKLTMRLYEAMADYKKYQYFLYGYGTNNGGLYIEDGATFYTYQRVIPRDSLLTLEELFRHEYTHYLNGRYAVPGLFGEAPWYTDNRTTSFDEGTAEYFAGSTRDQGVKVRKSQIDRIIKDLKTNSRPSVNEILHFKYDDAGYFFRYYSYACAFWAMLGRDHPDELREMYSDLRANNVAAFDDFLNRMGTKYQAAYDAFLDQQIAGVDQLTIPSASYTPVAQLASANTAEVQQAFATSTWATPTCATTATDGHPRFTCKGMITANIASTQPGQVHKDMDATVDYFILTRAGAATNNLADMNCYYADPELWSNGKAATSWYTCEGPLRP